MKKNNHLQKNLKFHCFKCQTLYQLMEVHSQTVSTCANECLTKWRELCHEYYQEKILGYLKQQEEQNEKALADSANWPDWLKKSDK